MNNNHSYVDGFLSCHCFVNWFVFDDTDMQCHCHAIMLRDYELFTFIRLRSLSFACIHIIRLTANDTVN
jgi:hypothetical protein